MDKEEDLANIFELISNPVMWGKEVAMITWLEMFLRHWLKWKASDEISCDIVLVGSVGEGMVGVSALMHKKTDVDYMIQLPLKDISCHCHTRSTL
jgi:hypothetical protein